MYHIDDNVRKRKFINYSNSELYKCEEGEETHRWFGFSAGCMKEREKAQIGVGTKPCI